MIFIYILPIPVIFGPIYAKYAFVIGGKFWAKIHQIHYYSSIRDFEVTNHGEKMKMGVLETIMIGLIVEIGKFSNSDYLLAPNHSFADMGGIDPKRYSIQQHLPSRFASLRSNQLRWKCE